MAEPKRRTVYKAKYTGRIWSTREDALKDNYKYKNNVEYRMQRKADTYKDINPTVSYSIPFIKSKKRTLTNAGLATGAVISENMLDTIAKHAKAVGLPIKTALGLATKETTLGNWTNDKTFHTLFEKGSLNRKVYGNMYNAQGPKQNINPGVDIDERSLVNFHDERNPYRESMDYAYKKAGKAASKAEWNADIGKAMEKTYAATIDILTKGEAYADKQAEKIKNIPKTHVLDAAFSKYKNNPNSYNPGQPNYPKLVEKRGNEVWNSPEIQSWYRRSLEDGRNKKPNGGIHIAPSKRGTLTAAATRHGMSVQGFASKVLANKENYSPAMVKKANFAKNASKWNH